MRTGAAVGPEDRRVLDEHATFVREMEQELRAGKEQAAAPAPPELEPGVKRDNAGLVQSAPPNPARSRPAGNLAGTEGLTTARALASDDGTTE